MPAGTFTMGDSSGDRVPADGEVPRHRVRIGAFQADATTVSNDDFAVFVADTGYRTEAETFGFSAVFHLALRAAEKDVIGRVAAAPWWLGVRGADWRHPGGSGSGLDGLGDHPVVHVSWNDAQAYCAWAGRRLPTEAEWEYLSRGGLEGATFPWGDQPITETPWRANVWQGDFPRHNSGEDGHLTTAPVRSYEPNGFGLWQTVGNVWEWCQDWFDPQTYARRVGNVGQGDSGQGAPVPRGAGVTRASTEASVVEPVGPATGQARVMRGGSYLCHASYCNRYRNSARSQNTPDSSTGNTGFRTVATRG